MISGSCYEHKQVIGVSPERKGTLIRELRSGAFDMDESPTKVGTLYTRAPNRSFPYRRQRCRLVTAIFDQTSGDLLMRYVFISALVLLTAVGLFVACNSNEHLLTQSPNSNPKTVLPGSTPHVATNPSDSARRITPEELHTLWEKNQVLIVDTRSEPAFKQSHIRGAILIPANDFASRSSELPRDKMIVTYCT
jgi:Rhodanese-like domain